MELAPPDFKKERVTMNTVAEITLESNPPNPPVPSQPEMFLSGPDRRLLLGASLRLLSRRFSYGKPILQNDVLRVASLADDVAGQAA